MGITVKIKSDFCFSYCGSLNKVPFIEEILIRNNGVEYINIPKVSLLWQIITTQTKEKQE